MTKDEMARLQDEIFQYCQNLREAGQKEYAHSTENAFRNFEAEAAKAQVDRKVALMIYFDKHIDGIWSAVRGHMSQREPVYGRICDAIVYLTLLYGMFLEDDKKRQEAQSPYSSQAQTSLQKDDDEPAYMGGGLISLLKEEGVPTQPPSEFGLQGYTGEVDLNSFMQP